MATFRKNKQGKWQVRVFKKGYNAKYKTFISKETAKKWAKDVESKMERMIFQDFDQASNIKLSELIIKYRDQVVVNHKANKQTSSKLNTLLSYQISKLYLKQIKPKDIFEFKKNLKTLRKSPKTINIYISLLKSVWKAAQTEWGIMLPIINPFIFIKQEKVNNYRYEVLNNDELQLLLINCKKSKLNCLNDIVEFAYLTGARINEILSLKRNHINLGERIAVFKDTKNGDDRDIPLSRRVMDIIKRNPFGEKVFNVSYGQVHYYFNIATKSSNIQTFRFHDLRACFCTNALLSGMSVAEVSAISGHKDWSQLKRYTRIKAKDLIYKIELISLIK